MFIWNLKHKNKLQLVCKLFITNILSLIIITLFPLFGIQKGSICESLAIPIQQIAYVVSNDKNVTDEQLSLIEKVIPVSDIKSNHYNMIVDGIKWHYRFNENYLKNHLSDYAKLYLELFIQNPKEYIEAYLLQTSGFWSFTVNGSEAYVSIDNWSCYSRDFKNKDLIHELTNISLRDNLEPKCYFSGGLFFWITIISFVITSQIANKRFLFGYLPLILLWGTIMIATPIAVSLRYVFVLVLALPLNLIYPFIAKKYSIEKN